MSQVLAKYGLRYVRTRSGFAHWDFVATTPTDLQTLAKAFGVFFEQDGRQISHSLNTVLISPEGKLKRTWVNNEWRAARRTQDRG